MEGPSARCRRRRGQRHGGDDAVALRAVVGSGQTLFQLYMQLAVTWSVRRTLVPLVGMRCRTTNGHAGNCGAGSAPAATGHFSDENASERDVSEMGALSVLVDAYLLRYMLATRCASSFKADAAKAREDG